MQEVSDHWVRKTSYMLEKGLSFRNQPGKQDLFTDIAYQELVSDPFSQLERVYRLFGGIPDSLRQRFLKAEAANPYGKYGIHEYSLRDFNLDTDELKNRNPAYMNLLNSVLNHGTHA